MPKLSEEIKAILAAEKAHLARIKADGGKARTKPDTPPDEWWGDHERKDLE